MSWRYQLKGHVSFRVGRVGDQPGIHGKNIRCPYGILFGDRGMGGRCLQLQRPIKEHSYDLGEIWKLMFGHNIVFAVCAVRNEAADWKLTEVNSFVQQLLKAPQYCQDNLEAFELACKKRYPKINNHIKYLDRLRFQMKEHEEADLIFFLNKASEHGLILEKVIPEYFVPPLELAKS